MICEVEAPKGALIDRSDAQDPHKKCCTNKLTIVRELSIDEIEKIIEKEAKRHTKLHIAFEYINAKVWIRSMRSIMEEDNEKV